MPYLDNDTYVLSEEINDISSSSHVKTLGTISTEDLLPCSVKFHQMLHLQQLFPSFSIARLPGWVCVIYKQDYQI
jgi:hypothetical protein